MYFAIIIFIFITINHNNLIDTEKLVFLDMFVKSLASGCSLAFV